MAGKNTAFSLGEHFSDFVAAQLNHGRYGNASEVVRAGLLEDQETHQAALRAALIGGEHSGPPGPFDVDAFIAGNRADPLPRTGHRVFWFRHRRGPISTNSGKTPKGAGAPLRPKPLSA